MNELKIENESGMWPVGWRILIKPFEIEEKSAGGIIINTESNKIREQMSNTTGVVIAMGDECFKDTKTRWCEVGNKVIFAKYAGLLYRGKDGVDYRMINDDDVTGVLDSDVTLVDPYLVTKKGS